MAQLEIDEIVKLIKLGKPQWVKQAILEHERLNVHVNGKNTDLYLTTIDKIENKHQFDLRKKYLTTNRSVFTNILRPVDKVFSANGGGVVYKDKSETKQETLRSKLENIRHGKPIRTWIKDIQANKLYTDPAGLVFFEWKDKKTYPTIKSIKSIYNYYSEGRELEWVLFNPIEVKKDGKPTGTKEYRFVDSVKDITLIVSDETVTIKEEFENPFEQVPAIINSNIVNSDLTHNESPLEPIISLADHYLRTGSIKNLNEFLHGYPIFWRYLTDCPTCQGVGAINGETCKDCNGKGVNLRKDITDIINLTIPEEDDTAIAPDVAGYVTPDVASWQEMRVELDWLNDLMQLTLWGSKLAKDATNETATAAFLNVQPVNDQLNAFADSFEDMERKMIALISKFYLGTKDTISVSYGRRFLIELPDVIWQKYVEAKEKGAPKTALDYLLMQFYQTEYSNDPESMAIALKSIKLEPFIHKTDEEVNSLPIFDKDKSKKFYFNEWFKMLTPSDIIQKDSKILEKEFETYLKTKENGTTEVQ